MKGRPVGQSACRKGRPGPPGRPQGHATMWQAASLDLVGLGGHAIADEVWRLGEVHKVMLCLWNPVCQRIAHFRPLSTDSLAVRRLRRTTRRGPEKGFADGLLDPHGRECGQNRCGQPRITRWPPCPESPPARRPQSEPIRGRGGVGPPAPLRPPLISYPSLPDR